MAAIRGMNHFLNYFLHKILMFGLVYKYLIFAAILKGLLAIWCFLFNNSSNPSCKIPSFFIVIFVSHRLVCYVILGLPQEDIRIPYLPAKATDLWTKLIFNKAYFHCTENNFRMAVGNQVQK